MLSMNFVVSALVSCVSLTAFAQKGAKPHSIEGKKLELPEKLPSLPATNQSGSARAAVKIEESQKPSQVQAAPKAIGPRIPEINAGAIEASNVKTTERTVKEIETVRDIRDAEAIDRQLNEATTDLLDNTVSNDAQSDGVKATVNEALTEWKSEGSKKGLADVLQTAAKEASALRENGGKEDIQVVLKSAFGKKGLDVKEVTKACKFLAPSLRG